MWSLAEFKQNMMNTESVRWILDRPVECLWCFEMNAKRSEIWAYLSDTSRLNRALGLSPREQIEDNGKIRMITTMVGFRQEWIEEPWTWLAERTICSLRTYIRGLATAAQAVFHIADHGDKYRVYIYFAWQPRNLIWRLFLRVTSPLLRRQFQNTLTQIDLHLQSENKAENALIAPISPVSKVNRVRLDELQKKLVAQKLSQKLSESLVDRLCVYISEADEIELESIRLIPLAKKWNAPLHDLVVIALHATRLGLLNISWKVICPHCRGSRFSASHLGEIPSSAECTICEIRFSTDDSESIEIVFHVHPSVREVKELIYCAAEPAKKSHIQVQQTVAPGSSFSIKLSLPEGLYRARFMQQSWSFEIENRSQTSSLDFNRPTQPFKGSQNLTLHFRNDAAAAALFVVEELWWQNSALKPAYLLSLWEFRDLFSKEHLDTHVKLYLGEQTILFTDIVGSTRFYQDVGDAKAFSQVRSHFQEVFAEVKSHHGVVVKTIGDAVMASFTSIANALQAGVSIQKRFHEARADTAIRLRISIHSGVVIAVQLNTGLDYFGNTVNVAAKIQSRANSGEIAFSARVHQMCVETQNEILKFPIEKRTDSRDFIGPADIYVVRIDADNSYPSRDES